MIVVCTQKYLNNIKNVVLDKVYYSEVYKYSDNLIKVFSEDVWNIMGYKNIMNILQTEMILH